MATIGEEAEAYMPPQTKSIAELPEISIDLELHDGEGSDKEGVKFKYKYIEVNGEQYRVPGKVLGDIKAIRKKNPNIKKFSVSKTGTGLSTQYTVIPGV